MRCFYELLTALPVRASYRFMATGVYIYRPAMTVDIPNNTEKSINIKGWTDNINEKTSVILSLFFSKNKISEITTLPQKNRYNQLNDRYLFFPVKSKVPKEFCSGKDVPFSDSG